MQKNFKEMIKRGGMLLGTWAQMASTEAVEMIGLQGFDFSNYRYRAWVLRDRDS